MALGTVAGEAEGEICGRRQKLPPFGLCMFEVYRRNASKAEYFSYSIVSIFFRMVARGRCAAFEVISGIANCFSDSRPFPKSWQVKSHSQPSSIAMFRVREIFEAKPRTLC